MKWLHIRVEKREARSAKDFKIIKNYHAFIFLHAHTLCNHDVICVCSLCAWARKNASKFVDVKENEWKREKEREGKREGAIERESRVCDVCWRAIKFNYSDNQKRKFNNKEVREKNEKQKQQSMLQGEIDEMQLYVKIEESRRSTRRQIVNDNVSKLSHTQTHTSPTTAAATKNQQFTKPLTILVLLERSNHVTNNNFL